MARTAKPLDPTRENALLRIAAQHFADSGYGATSLNQVITEAGWQKSSFYHYFADKRGLHDHVVRMLMTRLTDDVRIPELDVLTETDYWATMAELLTALGQAATRSPETWFLGEMFHRDTAPDQESQLQALRDRFARWIARAVARGRAIGVVRDDVPEELITELTVAVLQTLDRWAVRHRMHSPGGPQAAELSLEIVRDVIERRDHAAAGGSPTTPVSQ